VALAAFLTLVPKRTSEISPLIALGLSCRRRVAAAAGPSPFLQGKADRDGGHASEPRQFAITLVSFPNSIS
jgi:hypothetical protein